MATTGQVCGHYSSGPFPFPMAWPGLGSNLVRSVHRSEPGRVWNSLRSRETPAYRRHSQLYPGPPNSRETSPALDREHRQVPPAPLLGLSMQSGLRQLTGQNVPGVRQGQPEPTSQARDLTGTGAGWLLVPPLPASAARTATLASCCHRHRLLTVSRPTHFPLRETEA